MDEQRCRSQLMEWMREIVPYSNLDKYVRVEPYSPPLDGAFRVLLYTEAHSYSISVHTRTGHPPYLGCMAKARKERAGESWLRGNDLPDGPFSRQTWDAIKAAILRYELVQLDCQLIQAPLSSVPTISAAVSESVFYGPHECDGCGGMIVRQQWERGGLKFDSLGEGPDIYPSNRPDLPWQIHQCLGIHKLSQ